MLWGIDKSRIMWMVEIRSVIDGNSDVLNQCIIIRSHTITFIHRPTEIKIAYTWGVSKNDIGGVAMRCGRLEASLIVKVRAVTVPRIQLWYGLVWYK